MRRRINPPDDDHKGPDHQAGPVDPEERKRLDSEQLEEKIRKLRRTRGATMASRHAPLLNLTPELLAARDRTFHKESKLTPAVQQLICMTIEAGNTMVVAAALAGVGRVAAFRWMDLGKSAPEGHPYREFRKAVLFARAKAEADAVATIKKAGESGQWSASAWYLERTNPRKWGKKDVVQVGGVPQSQGGVPIQVGVVVYNLNDKDKLKEAPAHHLEIPSKIDDAEFEDD